MDPLRRPVAAVFARFLESRAARDLLAVALLSIAVFAISAALAVNERLMQWLLANARFQLDELPLVAFTAAVGLGWCAFRRWREYRAELRRRKALEQQLRIAATEADSANRAKSEFLASMSHELRTPLNSILGFSEALGSGHFGALTARQIDYVRDIHESGRHLLRIINDILDMAKLDAGRMTLSEEVVDIARVLEDCARFVRHRASAAEIALVLEPPVPPLHLRADELRLKQIVLNLMSNAVKFTPAQGRITVRAGRRRDGSFGLEVADTGVGMRPSDIAVALTPFAQVENYMTRKQEGTGLGLPIVKSLVDLHGGELLINSSPGKGTTVTVVLPASRIVRDPAG